MRVAHRVDGYAAAVIGTFIGQEMSGARVRGTEDIDHSVQRGIGGCSLFSGEGVTIHHRHL